MACIRSCIDNSTGGKDGVPLSDEMKAALSKANLPLATPVARRQRQGRRCQDAGHARCPTPCSRPISPTSPPRWCCRCSRPATSRSCWCSGRAIPTAASTITATASTPSRPASTARLRSPASGTPTTIWRSCARRSTTSGLPPPPTSSFPPTTVSRRFRRKARAARRRKPAIRTPRRISCRWVFSPSIWRER